MVDSDYCYNHHAGKRLMDLASWLHLFQRTIKHSVLRARSIPILGQKIKENTCSFGPKKQLL
jgi:hypothetical protein